MDKGSENKFIDISDSEINISCCGHSARIKRRSRRRSNKRQQDNADSEEELITVSEVDEDEVK